MLKELNKAIARQLVQRNGEVLRYILSLPAPHVPQNYDERLKDTMSAEGGEGFIALDPDDLSSGEEVFFQYGFPHYGFERT